MVYCRVLIYTHSSSMPKPHCCPTPPAQTKDNIPIPQPPLAQPSGSLTTAPAPEPSGSSTMAPAPEPCGSSTTTPAEPSGSSTFSTMAVVPKPSSSSMMASAPEYSGSSTTAVAQTVGPSKKKVWRPASNKSARYAVFALRCDIGLTGNARTLCAHRWLKQVSPNGSQEEFQVYFDSLSVEAKQVRMKPSEHSLALIVV